MVFKYVITIVRYNQDKHRPYFNNKCAKKTLLESGYDNLSPIFSCASLRRMTVRG